MQIDPSRSAGNVWATAVSPASPTERKTAEPEMIEAVKAVNKANLFGERYELTFSMDRQQRRMLVKLVDRDTKEVVRQVPAEYVLRLARNLGDGPRLPSSDGSAGRR